MVLSLVFYKLKNKSDYDDYVDGLLSNENEDKELLRKSDYDDPAGGILSNSNHRRRAITKKLM